jgi:hypothetical protein
MSENTPRPNTAAPPRDLNGELFKLLPARRRRGFTGSRV